MILCDETESRTHRKAGVWGKMTMDGLVRRTALAHPERIAIAGSIDRSGAGQPPRQVTYAQAEGIVAQTAALFHALDMKPGTVVGIQMSNTINSILVCLACWRARLIVAPIPAVWRQNEIGDTLEGQSVRALIATQPSEIDQSALRLRDSAVNLFNIRYVFGFGDDLPEGVINLDEMLSEIGDVEPIESLEQRGIPADHVATITWTSADSEDNAPVYRSHNQWLSAGMLTYLETRLADGASVLCPYGLTGMPAFAGAFVPWILSSGTLHLHEYDSMDDLIDHIAAVTPDLTLIPGLLANIVADQAKDKAPTCFVVVWPIRDVETEESYTAIPNAVDLTVLDEYGAIARRADTETNRRLIPTGKISTSYEGHVHPALLEVSVKVPGGLSSGEDGVLQSGELRVRGAMAPSPTPREASRRARFPVVSADKDGYFRTGFGCHIVSRGQNVAKPLGRLGDMIVVGGMAIPMHLLDELFKTFPDAADAAAFSVPDKAIGSRLYAAIVPKQLPFDAQAFQDYLDQHKIGLHKIPSAAIAVQSIPRGPNGGVHRSKLLETLTSPI